MKRNSIFFLLSILWTFIDAVASQRDFRIVGGHKARPNEFPFIVYIERPGKYCAGSIIAPKWVLTAGHCIVDEQPSDVQIRAGVHDLTKRLSGEQTTRAKSLIVHKGFAEGLSANDIGLIELAEPLNFSKTVSSVDVQHSQHSTEPNLAIIAGWGYVSLKGFGRQSESLQTATVPIFPHNICMLYINGIIHSYSYANLCTGPVEGKVGPCKGDSGGPLFVRSGRGFVQLGIMSSAYVPCASEDKPGIFTRVSTYLDWIKLFVRI